MAFLYKFVAHLKILEMVTRLEEILKQKAEEEHNEILYSQWQYDKEIIPAALEAIVTLFPHYSLHNQTHSVTIINNITRILGEDTLLKLSSIDLWLILESAYCHDLGMIVSAEEIDEVFREGFMEYYDEVVLDNYHTLNKYAIQFEKKEEKLIYKDINFSISDYDSMKYLLSDYFRKRHGERVKKAVNDPENTLAIKPPRAIIPPRMYHILGDICAAHTQSFDEVMELPFIEAGLGIENAHPRFIACLLRIGDLLDIDNYRFSETLLRTIKKIPKDSLLHKEKHASIKHLQINKKSIEIIAKCSDPRVAVVTQQWFDWIDQEFRNQIMFWNNIVPDYDLCCLPTINKLNVDLEDYEFIDNKQKPGFNIDVTRALELLRGSNIYRTPLIAIREILQNSVDASLLRMYLEHENEIKTIDDKFLKIAEKYPIVLTISTIENDKTKCEVKIKDLGIGISKEDLRFLSNTGSSSKNIKKNKIIECMPEELRPSGTFGIGFQSIFSITDKVSIRTKSYNTDEQYEIELYNPTSEFKGEIFIKRIPKEKERLDIGAEIIFTIEEKFFSGLKEYQNRMFFQETFDINLIINDMENLVNGFKRYSFFPIILDNPPQERTKFEYKESDKVEISTDFFGAGNFELLYKNVPVVNHGLQLKFFSPRVVNIHSPKANQILTLTRDSILEKEKNNIKTLIKNSVVDYYNNNTDLEKINSQDFSLFVNFYELDVTNKASIIDVRQIELFEEYKNELVKLGDIIDAESLTISVIKEPYPFRETKIKYKYQSNEKELTFKHYEYSSNTKDKLIFIFKHMLSKGKFYLNAKRKDNDKVIHEYCYFKGHTNYSPELDLNECINALNNINGIYYIPYIKGFDNIRISYHKIDSDYFEKNDHEIRFSTEVIIFPFIIENGHWKCICQNDHFIKWIYNNRSNMSADRDSIKAEYVRFVEECAKIYPQFSLTKTD